MQMTTNSTNRDPITALAEAAMQAFARATNCAGEGSPLARARAKLGDGYFDAACRALRKHVLAALTCEENKDLLAHAPAGLPVGEMILATIVADALNDVINAAELAAN